MRPIKYEDVEYVAHRYMPIRLPVALHKRLKDKGHEENVSMAEIVRLALTDYLDK